MTGDGPGGRLTAVFLGGGTGGHIFPAIAIAEELKRADARTVLVAGDGAMDAELRGGAVRSGAMDAAVLIPARPLSVRPRGLVRLIASMPRAVRGAAGEIERSAADGPVVAVAMGGYVAVPGVLAARRLGVPVVLVNLDAVPGKSNRWVARRAAGVVSALHEGRGLHAGGGVRVVPPVVRTGVVFEGSRDDARTRLGLDPDRRTLFVCGASQGARSVNRFVAAWAETEAERLRAHGWQVLHQTGAGGHDDVARAYDAAGVPAVVVEFLEDMGAAWAAADLAVARSGAGLVAEAWATRTPAVFLPYPHHRDEHQRVNAEALVSRGAAVVVRDEVDVRANLRGAGGVLSELCLSQSDTLATMRAAADGLPAATGPGGGAAMAAAEIVRLGRG